MKYEKPQENSENEKRDVSLKAASAVAFGIFVLFIGFIFLSEWYFHSEIIRQAGLYENFTLPSETAGPRPGAWTSKDLENYRHQEDSLLNSYSWNDVSKGYATVPVRRAMDLAIKERLLKPEKSDSDVP